MASSTRKNVQELYDLALSFVPSDGSEIDYTALHANISASDTPSAVSMLPELKKRKAVIARIEVVDGQKVHTYRRASVE